MVLKGGTCEAGLSSAGAARRGAALIGLGAKLFSQGIIIIFFRSEEAAWLDLHRLSALPSPPPHTSTSKRKGGRPKEHRLADQNPAPRAGPAEGTGPDLLVTTSPRPGGRAAPRAGQLQVPSRGAARTSRAERRASERRIILLWAPAVRRKWFSFIRPSKSLPSTCEPDCCQFRGRSAAVWRGRH